VGDRLDNDVIPAMQAGMLGVFIRRGPWAALQAAAAPSQADAEIQSLLELTELMRAP
jgi:FMN phosphatase YigB (HAD superfamily)